MPNYFDTPFDDGNETFKVRAFEDPMVGWRLAILTKEGQVVEPYREVVTTEAIQDARFGDPVQDAVGKLIERYFTDRAAEDE